MKKIILAIVLVLVVAAGLLLLAQVQSHEGYFAPVYSPDGSEVYFIARRSMGLVAGLGIESFTAPAYVFVWHDRFSLRKLAGLYWERGERSCKVLILWGLLGVLWYYLQALAGGELV